MKAFRCSRTGVLFPGDYVEEWGKRYGIGLGSVPVSEALTNRYDIPVASSRDERQTMHPVGVCRAQVDLVDVPEEEFTANAAVLAIEDISMERRAPIMRGRQLLKSPAMISLFPGDAAAAASKEKAGTTTEEKAGTTTTKAPVSKRV